MARKRRSRPLTPVRFTGQILLGTLANETVSLTPVGAVLEQDFDVVSTDLTVAMRDHTANEGPIDCGIAAEDYTVTEIGECLNAQPLRAVSAEMERSRRRVRTYGIFDGEGPDEKLNDGLVIRRKMFLRAPAGQVTANFWARNRSNANLTTGTAIEFAGVHWGRWR